MGIFKGIGLPGMPQDMLGDIKPGDAVQMGGGGMAEQAGMKLFVNIHGHGRVCEDILNLN